MRRAGSLKSQTFPAVVAMLLMLDWMAWLAVVPAGMTSLAFVQLNALVIVMFVTGLVSAGNGRPTPSVAQLLYEVEHPTRDH